MLSHKLLTEIFSFFDRKFLETVVRAVSRHFDAILSAHCATIPHYVIDSIVVDVFFRRFQINGVEYYDNVVREGHVESAEIVFDAARLTPFRKTIRHETHEFVRAALPGGGGVPVPRYLRILRAHFSVRCSDKYDYSNQDDFLRDVIATFAPAWTDYAPGNVAFNFYRSDLNSVDALLRQISVPALTLHSWDVELMGMGFESLFAHPTVRNSARLQILYSTPAKVIAMDALPSNDVVGWLHSAPKMSSSHEIEVHPKKQRERSAKVALRELQIVCPTWQMDFDYFKPLVTKIANAFIEDTVRREFKVEFLFNKIFPNDPRPPPAELINESTRECLRFEWREWEANSLQRDAFVVTRLPQAPTMQIHHAANTCTLN